MNNYSIENGQGIGLYDEILFCYEIQFTLTVFSVIFRPKIAPKGNETNQQMRIDATVNQKVEKQQQASGSGLTTLTISYQAASAPTIPRPRIDATDRRHIEAQNEDKSRSTKETLDDIKRVHYKEKKKKEPNVNEAHQPRIHVGRSVSYRLI